MNFKIFLGITILSIGSMIVTAQDAKTILGKMDQVIFSPKDRQANVTMILTDKAGKEKVREAIMLQKGNDKRLYRYTKPESQSGVATLSLPGDVMWLYMPAFGKPKRISLLAKSQAFTGTDFSYEDMSTLPYSERYDPVLVETGADSYMLELTPKSDKSSYSKIIATINKTHGYPLTMSYYDNKGKNTKVATYRYEKIGSYWNAAEVLMMSIEKNQSTKILLSDVKFDQDLPDSLFEVENLNSTGEVKDE
jgi:outer membrane lipoprotein-sorting protein